MANHHTKVLIIGSGPAGYTAAIYAARGMMEPILVAGMQQGGQLTITTEVENYPGYAEAVQGPWMMEQMLEQAKNVGTTVIEDSITKAELNVRPFRFEAESGDTYTADSVIICTGGSSQMAWSWNQSKPSWALAFPHVRLAMAFSIATNT